MRSNRRSLIIKRSRKRAPNCSQPSRLNGWPSEGSLIMAIELSERAVQRIQEILKDQDIAEGGLRVGVKGGGCSGLSYLIDLETQVRPGDKVFEREGVKVFVDT